ncbi:MAG: FAD-dependent oxidoreductase [Syntrophobacteraceae bacterium]
MKDSARVVVIGGGITGCSILYHLAKAGWKDLVMVEKNEITSGATCMAMGLLTQFNSSPTMMRFRKYSSEMYTDLGVFEKVGSLRVASSKTQHLTLLKEVSQAKGVGLDVDIISPKEALKIMPWMSGENVYSAVYLPQDGHLDPHGATHAVAKAARDLGAIIYTDTRVTGIDLTPDGAIAGVRTNKGDIRCEIVVNCAGLWAAQVAAMVGAKIPSTPVVHQHAGLGAVPGSEIPEGAPCFRDTEYLIYGRPEHGGVLLGGWETNPVSTWEDGVPWSHAATELPTEFDRFEPLFENAVKRFPFLAEAGLERLIAHPDAFTPDSRPLLGPWPGVKGFWLACGLSMNGFGGAGGIGKSMAEWITQGSTEVDLYGFHAWRFGRNYLDPFYAASCARECYRYYYYTRYPHDEDVEMRPRRISPIHYRLQDLGAVFGKKNGWERVNYCNPGEPWRRAGEDQREWGAWVKPPYFERVGVEHKAFREAAGMVDLSSFGKIDFKGPGALPLLQRLAISNMDKPVGSVMYTQFCNHKGGLLADVTITRLGGEHFRLVTGSGYIDNDFGHVISQQCKDDPEVEIRDVTEEYACMALWGPKAAAILQSVTSDDLSNEALPYMQCRTITVNGVKVTAQRLSYVGEKGWELYAPVKRAIVVWDAVFNAGQAHGLEVGGYKTLDGLRMEKGYLYYGGDITTMENPYEAGLAFNVHLKKDADFLGKAALAKAREAGVSKKLCTVVIGGEDWLPLYGGEAVLSGGKVVSRLRSTAYGYTVKRNIAMVYLPVELAVEGTKLEVEIFGEKTPAEVTPRVLYDPKGAALKA